MKQQIIMIINILMFVTFNIKSQNVNLIDDNLEAINVIFSTQKLDEENAIKIVKDPKITAFDEPTYVKIKNFSFGTGTIEIKVLSRLLPDAPDLSRGFIGLAFHIDDENTKFECIYLRPVNARAESQIQRNHSIQYFAYPEYKFQKLREEYPCVYESYADMALNEWINLRIDVEEKISRLYINGNKEPSLIINSLHLYNSNKAQNAIGLFVDVGTEGFFKDLKVYKRK